MRRWTTRCRSLSGGLICALAALLAPAGASAQTFTFERIADTATAIPSGSGTFTDFGTPAQSGTGVVFRGFGSGLAEGIYRSLDAALVRIADRATAIPSGTGSFVGFGRPAISAGTIAFRGVGGDFQEGIYTRVGDGALARSADRSLALPSGTGSFVAFGEPSVFQPGGSSARVAFRAGGTSFQDGIYEVIGTARTRVVDRGTAVPSGSGSFTGFVSPDLDGSARVFHGLQVQSTGSSSGVYRTTGTTTTRLVDTTTAVPGGGSFRGFEGPVADAGTVAFRGATTLTTGASEGIYALRAGTLIAIADRGTGVPGGGSFETFSPPSVSGPAVAFAARTSGLRDGLFSDLGGTLASVVRAGDVVDGRVVAALVAGPQALDGSLIAFRARFDDGSAGVYRAVSDSDLVASGTNAAAEVLGGVRRPTGIAATFPTATSGVFRAVPASVDVADVAALLALDVRPESLNFALPTSPGQFWSVTFSGTFTGSVTLVIRYDDADFLPGVAEASLLVYRYVTPFAGCVSSVTCEWLPLTVTARDLTANTITVTTPGFSAFALGLPRSDLDGDGVADARDLCPHAPDPEQRDRDGDGIGDACECGDASGDGRLDSVDARLIQRCSVGAIPCAPLCDASGDGRCSAVDARLVQRVVVGALLESGLACRQRGAVAPSDALTP